MDLGYKIADRRSTWSRVVLPVAQRRPLRAYRGEGAGPRIAAKEAATLIIQARDDTLPILHNTEIAAAQPFNVQLRRFEDRGCATIIVSITDGTSLKAFDPFRYIGCH